MEINHVMYQTSQYISFVRQIAALIHNLKWCWRKIASDETRNPINVLKYN